MSDVFDLIERIIQLKQRCGGTSWRLELDGDFEELSEAWDAHAPSGLTVQRQNHARYFEVHWNGSADGVCARLRELDGKESDILREAIRESSPSFLHGLGPYISSLEILSLLGLRDFMGRLQSASKVASVLRQELGIDAVAVSSIMVKLS